MPVLLGQLVYTSFPGVGLRAIASTQVPAEIQQAFIQQVVYQHWDAYHPPSSGYRAAYVYQVTPEQSLFGWLYNDGVDDLGRQHVPYFLCYYLAAPLFAFQLENIFTCLLRGPIALIDRQRLPDALEPIVAPDLWAYEPARLGVMVPFDVCQRGHLALKQRQLLDLLISVEVQQTVTQHPPVMLSPEKSSNVGSSNSTRPNFVLGEGNFQRFLGVGVGIGLAAVMGVLYAELQLNEIKTLKAQAKYEECITRTELESWAAETVLHEDAQRLLNECRLERSKILATSGKLASAIAVAAKIPENSPLYPKAQKLIKEWLEI